ncbi:hypothetical protein B0H67DRAFT_524230 [Lasiosphaeris hirsuta]|uniref:HNH nuclease domain-containing protein n=1 Tax=Lasiosphaeris hirsuta TaxID=260670 RepID=A0AA39ZPF2_9PEZI|nr:hypothetical protein B0H67DRAFT_524230 [Lasiosphaeris hirsuta]
MATLPPFTPPAITHGLGIAQREVRFRHPAYPNSAPHLLVLMAADGDGGLDFDVALTSCCIVADIGWDNGYLTQKDGAEDDGLRRIDRPPDGLLRGREFFFCVEGCDPLLFKYPVIPSFYHWRFPHGGFDEDGAPHGNLPPLWRNLWLPEFIPPRPTLKGPAAALDRDMTCRVSEYMDALENAHLVPVKERLWFVSNGMDRYCRRPLEISAINDDKNMLILRKDLHHLFDARRFTFVPKRFGTDVSQSAKLVTHVLLPSGSPELIGLYHNRSPQPIRGISVACLFARFAWSLFTDEHIPFFGSSLTYAVRLWDEAKGETETQSLRGLDVGSRAQIFESTRSQSRSVSPTKRSVSTHGCRQDIGRDVYSPDDGDIIDDGGIIEDGHDCDSWDEPPRGRPRKRSWDTSGRDGQVPSLSRSYASMTQSSLASLPGRRLSQTLTQEDGDTTASPDAAVGTTGSQRPQNVYMLKKSRPWKAGTIVRIFSSFSSVCVM